MDDGKAWVALRKAIWSFRLRLYSGLRQRGAHSSRKKPRDEWGTRDGAEWGTRVGVEWGTRVGVEWGTRFGDEWGTRMAMNGAPGKSEGNGRTTAVLGG